MASTCGFRQASRLLALTLLATLFTASAALAAPPGSRWGRNHFPNYEVVAHNGERFKFYDDLIENKLVIINFIYTRCTDICPLQTARMAEVYDELKQHMGDRIGKDVFFYSITLEPEYDTPELLGSLADAFGTGPGWYFLTGDPEQIGEIRDSLGEGEPDLNNHGNGMMIGDDGTAQWEGVSITDHVDQIVETIRQMDPVERSKPRDLTELAALYNKHRGPMPDGKALYDRSCGLCHSVGENGKTIGPDLYGLLDRRDRGWLEQYLTDPPKMLASGDPIAVELDRQYPGARMPYLSLSKLDIADVLSYIKRLTAQADAELVAPKEGEAAQQ